VIPQLNSIDIRRPHADKKKERRVNKSEKISNAIRHSKRARENCSVLHVYLFRLLGDLLATATEEQVADRRRRIGSSIRGQF
jgi:hypothetical protein